MIYSTIRDAVGSIALAAALITTPDDLHGQAVLTLKDAIQAADSAAFQNRIASGNAKAQSAGAASALQGIIPSIRVEAGYVRTDDPLGAFGFLMRQRGVTAAAFDPSRLNSPEVSENWSGSLIAEVPLLNLDAWMGRAAAVNAARAASASREWTRAEVRLNVVRAYYGAIMASEQIGALESALSAATEHHRQAQLMVDNGLATPSDALLAAVQRGQVQAGLLAAQSQAEIATAQLKLLMGMDLRTAILLPDSLPDPGHMMSVEPADEDRHDLMAARYGAQAAEYDVKRSNSTLLPRINAFGSSDWHTANKLFGATPSHTVGVMASWAVFSGGARGDRIAASARREAAQAMLEGAEEAAELEIKKARSELSVADAQLEIARRSVVQSADALRLVERRYEAGLATAAELLSAAATNTSTQLGLTAARYRLITAEASLRHALGASFGALTEMENQR